MRTVVAYVTRWTELEPLRIEKVRSWYIKEGTLVIHHGKEYPDGQQRYDQQVFSLAYYSHFHFAVEDADV